MIAKFSSLFSLTLSSLLKVPITLFFQTLLYTNRSGPFGHSFVDMISDSYSLKLFKKFLIQFFTNTSRVVE